MSPLEIVSLLAGASGLLAGLIALFKAPFELRRESKKVKFEGDSSFAQEARKLLEEKIVLLENEEKYKDEISSSKKKIDDLTISMKRLEKSVPLALVTGKWLQDPAHNDIGRLLDKSRDLFVITSPAEGGTFLWVNAAWERVLGYGREELIGTTWRTIIHPVDLRRTERAEGAAWGEDVGVVNRYKRKDGKYAQLRWYASRYVDGLAISLARVEAIF